jgi:hypothetical protein
LVDKKGERSEKGGVMVEEETDWRLEIKEI